jgi:hypothetical protein
MMSRGLIYALLHRIFLYSNARDDTFAQVSILAARCARVMLKAFAQQRAWGMPDARCTRSRVRIVKSTRVSHHGRTGIPGIPARDGFNSLFRALPGDRACLPPSPRGYRRVGPVRADIASAKLDASVGASGPHDFAVRKIALSSAAPLRIPCPTFVTIAKRPLCVGRDGERCRGDLD